MGRWRARAVALDRGDGHGLGARRDPRRCGRGRRASGAHRRDLEQAILAGDTRVTTREDGDCVLEDTFAPHAIKSVTYTVRTCPTSTGVRSALVESGDLARFQSTWEVHAADAGATVVYDLEVAPTFPLPAFIARASVKKGVGDALEAVRWHFDAAR